MVQKAEQVQCDVFVKHDSRDCRSTTVTPKHGELFVPCPESEAMSEGWKGYRCALLLPELAPMSLPCVAVLMTVRK